VIRWIWLTWCWIVITIDSGRFSYMSTVVIGYISIIASSFGGITSALRKLLVSTSILLFSSTTISRQLLLSVIWCDFLRFIGVAATAHSIMIISIVRWLDHIKTLISVLFIHAFIACCTWTSQDRILIRHLSLNNGLIYQTVVQVVVLPTIAHTVYCSYGIIEFRLSCLDLSLIYSCLLH